MPLFVTRLTRALSSLVNSDHKLDSKLIIILAWVAFGAIGDEVFALVFYDTETAFGSSLNKTWWWTYQAVVAILFGALYFLAPKINSSEHNETETD